MKMKKLMMIAAVFLLMTCFFAVSAAAGADVLQGVWSDAAGSTTYEFDGSGSGSASHGAHGHSFTYTVDGDALRLVFSGDNHGLPSSFTFAVEGDSLELTAEGKTAVQRYTRVEGAGDSHDHEEGVSPVVWFLSGAVAGAVLTVIAGKMMPRGKSAKRSTGKK